MFLPSGNNSKKKRGVAFSHLLHLCTHPCLQFIIPSQKGSGLGKGTDHFVEPWWGCWKHGVHENATAEFRYCTIRNKHATERSHTFPQVERSLLHCTRENNCLRQKWRCGRIRQHSLSDSCNEAFMDTQHIQESVSYLQVIIMFTCSFAE